MSECVAAKRSDVFIHQLVSLTDKLQRDFRDFEWKNDFFSPSPMRPKTEICKTKQNKTKNREIGQPHIEISPVQIMDKNLIWINYLPICKAPMLFITYDKCPKKRIHMQIKKI